MQIKICSKCKIEYNISEFNIRGLYKNESTQYRGECKRCQSDYSKKYYKENDEELKANSRQNGINNKDKIKEKNKKKRDNRSKEQIEYDRIYHKQYYQDNKEEIKKQNKQSYIENREIISKRNQKYKTKRKQNDHQFRLRCYISTSIYQQLKARNISKNKKSVMDLVPFDSIQILWAHIESLFSHPDNLTPDGKIWMTKENQGKYNPKIWNDNDPTTWTWQLDHIIPQSTFDFRDSEQIKQCWSLSNLRPLSAKQNILDGNRR